MRIRQVMSVAFEVWSGSPRQLLPKTRKRGRIISTVQGSVHYAPFTHRFSFVSAVLVCCRAHQPLINRKYGC